ncbi:acetyl-CoA carboxylase biotin carboxyl carrier protein [Marinomonas primoryensis]|uniref:Biotin carboxyl carrier protein of acetyl-CoA carboxylase n=1 Tax=Marinomonas primoryensis TaxID=178399 RepID=A0A859D4H0_9GAMM|nr:acetyl-CoA carboxylase biotin carboxyl carrier protein [Marinomonas primoryensis]QKK81861.1 acetyl-CoA carboxylase biotin carboxyl carrier protein [Marinomonas primoryensis]
MKNIEITLNDIKILTEWVNENNDIKEFSLNYQGLELFISRNEEVKGRLNLESSHVVPEKKPSNEIFIDDAVSISKKEPSSKEVINKKEEIKENEVIIKAPMVGTFYKSSSPDTPAFVEVGQAVKPDSVLCIIEVMKLMNNLEAKVNGTVKEIYVEDNQAVEFGQPLMLIIKD